MSGKTQGKGQMQPLIYPVKELAGKSCEFRELGICLSMYFQVQRYGSRLVKLEGLHITKATRFVREGGMVGCHKGAICLRRCRVCG